ncbi:hypothetical protein B7P43_G00613 [Cryptotermes secundus]|uniref:DUF4817 domain-containing protein n=1 Tax=Cryptotermes secundus TaxID=105785 RepID=A0A2J7PUZ8_9NEOP|nr:hypothetical protein B7P43_G00613 [Cryptotermes secundus]
MGKSPRYPLDRRLGGPQKRSGRHRAEKILDPTVTRTPTPRSARSQSLYRLSYPESKALERKKGKVLGCALRYKDENRVREKAILHLPNCRKNKCYAAKIQPTKSHEFGMQQGFSVSNNDQVKEDEEGRSCSANVEKKNVYRILVEKPEGKRPQGRPRRRWVDGIRVDLREIGWDGMDWIDLAQDRDQWRALVNTLAAPVQCLYKRATKQEKSFGLLEYTRCSSVIAVQRALRREYEKEPPCKQSILRWYRQFKDTGCLCKRKSTGQPNVPDETVERVRESFMSSLQKSTVRASRELGPPQQIVWKILRRRLHFKPYRPQLLQQLKPEDYGRRLEYCVTMQEAMEDEDFAAKLIFSDEATFNLSGKVNRHNVRLWGTENPRAIVALERDSPKLNVFCAMSQTKLYGPFFFCEKTVTGTSYLDMLQLWLWLFPQLVADSGDFVFQQDGAPPHWNINVRRYLNNELRHRWIGRVGEDDAALFAWPPRSPDLTPCDFFLWGYIKDRVYVPPLPRTLVELRERIDAAVMTIDRMMLQNVWNELDYRLDVCRVTQGAHIEHL